MNEPATTLFFTLACTVCAVFFLGRGLSGWRSGRVRSGAHEYEGRRARIISGIYLAMGATAVVLAVRGALYGWS